MYDDTDFVLLHGSIQIPRSLSSRPRDMVNQGDTFPGNMFLEAEITGWLEDGKIKFVPSTADTAAEEIVLTPPGKWHVDPEVLIDKDMEGLLLLVLDIDPLYDVDSLTDMGAVVRLLTKNFDREQTSIIAPAVDKSSASAMRPEDGVKDFGSRDLASVAAEALAAAKARASGETDETQE